MPRYGVKAKIEQEIEVIVMAKDMTDAETKVRDGEYHESYCDLTIVLEIKSIREVK